MQSRTAARGKDSLRSETERSALSLQAPVCVEVTQRLLRVTELLVQPRRVVVRVGEVGCEAKRGVVARERSRGLAGVLERDRAVVVEQRLVRLDAQRFVVEADRVAGPAGLA